MGPLKVSMLWERIFGTYLHVSNMYIMPAERSVYPPLCCSCSCQLTVRPQSSWKFTQPHTLPREPFLSRKNVHNQPTRRLFAVDYHRARTRIDILLAPDSFLPHLSTLSVLHVFCQLDDSQEQGLKCSGGLAEIPEGALDEMV